MNRFQIGNVIKTKYGSIEVIYNIKSDGYTSTIPINASNALIGHRDKTYTDEVWCDCGQIDCEYCREGKPQERIVYGMEEAEFIAYNIQEWITKTLTKGFEFK